MNRKWHVLLTAMFVLALVLSACSNRSNNGNNQSTETPSQSDNQTNSQTNNQTDNQTDDQENGSDDGTTDGKYDPPITLTTARADNPNYSYAPGDSVDNNPWTRAYLERYGIIVKHLFTTDGSQFPQRINLAIASGDLPDFFQVSATQLKQLVDAGQLADLTEGYAGASEGVKGLLTAGGNLALESATFDGKLMAVPWTSGPKEGANMVWVRADWLKKLNLPEPKTMDDVFKISEAFATMDPDGNNQNDTFGLSVDKDLVLMNGFFNSFHAYKDIWVKDASGNLAYGSIQPEMKQALAKLNEMYRSKQIDPEFGTKGIPEVFESLSSGKVGIHYGTMSRPMAPFQAGMDLDPEMDWKAFPLMSVDAQPALNQHALGVIAYNVVRNGVEHPEALFKMLDFWHFIFYENTDPDIYAEYHFEPGTNNNIWMMNSIAAYKEFETRDQYLKVKEALQSNDTAGLNAGDMDTLARVKEYLDTGDRSLWGWNAVFGEGGSLSVVDYYDQNNLYKADEFFGAPTDVMAEKLPTLNTMQIKTFADIILGNAPIDSFDSFVEQWKSLGGDEITQAVNDWTKSR